jgi:hypothetical protein
VPAGFFCAGPVARKAKLPPDRIRPRQPAASGQSFSDVAAQRKQEIAAPSAPTPACRSAFEGRFAFASPYRAHHDLKAVIARLDRAIQ